MTKRLIGSAAALAAAAAMSVPTIPALANSDNAATIFKLDGLCEYRQDGFVAFGDIHYVDTKANVQILVCQGEAVSGPELQRPYQRTGFTCVTPFGSSTNSRTIITPTGKFTSVCKFDLENGS